MQFTTIGLDVAKNVFQVHGVGSVDGAVVRRRLRRAEVLPFFEGRTSCLVGVEACASAIIGPARSRSLGTRSGSCRRSMSALM
jgi:transposase